MDSAKKEGITKTQLVDKMKVQQYHKSVSSAKKQIKTWNKDHRSSWNQDYGDYSVLSVRKAKTGTGGGKNAKTPTGRFLYDITLKKRKK